MVKINKIPIILLVILTIAACKESDSYHFPKQNKIDCQYVMFDSGAWREFQVTEIKIDEPISLYDTQTYFVREQIGGIFIDNLGDTMRQIERFRRKTETEKWNRLNTWVTGIIGSEVIQVEENVRYLKMQLPLYASKTWNGNIYNRTDTLQEYDYEVDSIDCQMIINNFEFDSVLTISQKKELTAITKIHFFERYAVGVGLVEKQQIDIYSDTYNPDIDIMNRITQGTITDYCLIGYGK